MRGLIALLLLAASISLSQSSSPVMKYRTVYFDSSRANVDSVRNLSRERFYRPVRFDSSARFYGLLQDGAGNNYVFPGLSGTLALASSGGSVGNADSLGSYPASAWFRLADTTRHYYTKLYAKLNFADTTGDWAPKGVYIFPSDTTSMRSFSNIKYWSKADLDTAVLHYAKFALKLNASDTTGFRAHSDSLYAWTDKVNIFTTPNYFTARQYATSLEVDSITGRLAGTRRQLNLLGSSGRIISGDRMSSDDVPFVNLFGGLNHAARQTVGGFAYANSLDTIREGHITISGGVPFLSRATTNSSGTGLQGSGFGMKSDATDTSSFWFQLYNGAPDGAGTSTTALQLTKYKGDGSSSNYQRYDGNKFLTLLRIDTSNHIIFNAAKSSEFNYGAMFLQNGYFSVENGYTNQDSVRLNLETIITKTYHSGLSTHALGSFTTDTITGAGGTLYAIGALWNAVGSGAANTRSFTTTSNEGGGLWFYDGATGGYIPAIEGYSNATNSFGLIVRGRMPSANDVYTAGRAAMIFSTRLDSTGTTPVVNSDAFLFQNGTTTLLTLASDGLARFTAEVQTDSAFTMNERATTPTLPTSNTQMHMYMKGDKVVWVINAAGTPRYYYFDATATSNQSIIYSATAP